MKLIRPRGYITSGYKATEAVRAFAHTGVDLVFQHKAPIFSATIGEVSWVCNKDNPDLQKFRGVYTISETDIGTIETCYGHLWDVYVNEGDKIPANLAIGTQGNTGEMTFVNGHQVTSEEKLSGAGSHLHFSIRPVVLEDKKIIGEHYRPYKFRDKYVRVAYKDNGAKGCIDPVPYFYTPTRQQLIVLISKVVGYLANKLKNLNG